LDRFLREGKNEFTIQATDQIGNTRIRKYQFVKATQNKQKKSKKGPQKNFQTQEKE
jgi:C4-type Zn-finger protein